MRQSGEIRAKSNTILLLNCTSMTHMDEQPREKIPVALVRCPGYEEEEAEQGVRQATDLIGGIGSFLSPGMHVLVKPNLLMGAPPERAVCTHPTILEAVCRLLTTHGCTVTIADSPGAGIPYRTRNLLRAYDQSGYTPLAGIPGVTLNQDTSSRTTPFSGGRLVRQFEIISPVLDADAVVVVSKLKTHIFTGMTGAVKNLFGTIPGLDKPPFHARLQDESRFGEMLLDLNRRIRPVLQIMDAIDIMEGDGPMAGRTVRLGAILASPDPVALDSIACRLIGIEPLSIGSIRAASDQGLFREEEVEIRGEDPGTLAMPGVEKPKTRREKQQSLARRMIQGVLRRLGQSYTLHPTLKKSACTRCHQCERTCPVGAISLKNGYPRFDYATCICCYCCHEMCDSHAIGLSPGILHRALRPLIR